MTAQDEAQEYFLGMRRFRGLLGQGKPVVGAAVTFSDALISDALADSVDFLWYDMEHAQMDPCALNFHLMAARGKETASLVRVADVHPSTLKPVLDAGAEGIVVAQVHSVDEVKELVNNCVYPPEGVRGLGPRVPTNYGRFGGAQYVALANEMVFTSVMIETAEALDAIDEIVNVNRLDSIVIGPYDLSGAIGTFGEVDSPAVNDAIDRIIAAARAAGVYVGMGMPVSPRFASSMLARGVNWIQLGSDFEYMIQRVDAARKEIDGAS
jgi:4-hydroxy-2-oxoheptanedioate aldolase